MTILTFNQSYFSNFIKPSSTISCNRRALSELLVQQWKKLTLSDIEKTRYVKRDLAKLIEINYGIDHIITEDYISNIERRLSQAA